MTTVTIGANTTDTFSGTIDVEINSFTPTATQQSAQPNSMLVQQDANPNHCLIAFGGLSNIVGPVSVSDAKLHLFLGSENSFTTPLVEARRLLRNWVEAEATWNKFSTAGGNWGTAGAIGDGVDRVATVSGSAAIGNGTGIYYVIPGLAADVEGFINGTFSNFGWVLQQSTTQGDWKSFWTREGGPDGQRPFLEVTYGAAGGGSIVATRAVGRGAFRGQY